MTTDHVWLDARVQLDEIRGGIMNRPTPLTDAEVDELLPRLRIQGSGLPVKRESVIAASKLPKGWVLSIGSRELCARDPEKFEAVEGA